MPLAHRSRRKTPRRSSITSFEITARLGKNAALVKLGTTRLSSEPASFRDRYQDALRELVEANTGREPTEIANDTRRCREMTKPAGPASKIRQPLNMSPAS